MTRIIYYSEEIGPIFLVNVLALIEKQVMGRYYWISEFQDKSFVLYIFMVVWYSKLWRLLLGPGGH